MSTPWVLAMIAGVVVSVGLLPVAYLVVVVMSTDRRTRGLAYFGLPPAQRASIRRRLALHARILRPLLELLSRASPFSFERERFTFAGISGPKGTCSAESFERASRYAPASIDVFVASQMRSGTTWTLNLVYQLLTRGRGDPGDSGRTLYSISPWIEADIGVPITDAPRIGSERPSRIVKTHLPASLCPFSPDARYVYVVRHPVSCFASCVDFLAGSLGPFAPDLLDIEEWFRSDELMWWGTWPTHVGGWWQRSAEAHNVMIVRYEDMLADLRATADRIASFIGLSPATEDEWPSIAEACGFDHMRRHRDAFEMYPPHLLSVDRKLFVRGDRTRHLDVPAGVRQRIETWCSERMASGPVPLSTLYP